MKEDLRRKRLLELNELLRANVMIRRMKADVEKDLPEKTRQIITIEERTQAVVKQMEIYSSYEDGLKKAKVELEIAKATLNDEDYREALKNYKQTVSYPFEEIAKYRLEVGRDKLKHAIDQIEDMLEENIKMVVFTYHQEIVEALYAKFGPSISVLSTGKTSAQASQKAVDDFQNNDSIRIFFGTMKANNTGITLTAASYALFVEQDWVPATMLQAEDRIHRIGQTAKSTMLHLVFKNSIDEKLMETIIKKMETINLALNENTVDDDLSMTVIPGSEAYSLRFMTRKEYMQKASMISPQRISEIYIELKELLAMNIDFKQTMYLNIAQRLLNMPESKMAAVLAERCIKALKTKENGFKEE
jgi:SNF2 family DNA or RNA helicase